MHPCVHRTFSGDATFRTLSLSPILFLSLPLVLSQVPSLVLSLFLSLSLCPSCDHDNSMRGIDDNHRNGAKIPITSAVNRVQVVGFRFYNLYCQLALLQPNTHTQIHTHSTPPASIGHRHRPNDQALQIEV